MIYLLVLPMTLFGALGAFFFKKVKIDNIYGLLTDKYMYLGGGFYAFGALINIWLLRKMNYTIIYPMGCLTYIWTAILSKWLLGETITIKKVIGIALLILGVVILAISNTR